MQSLEMANIEILSLNSPPHSHIFPIDHQFQVVNEEISEFTQETDVSNWFDQRKCVAL